MATADKVKPSKATDKPVVLVEVRQKRMGVSVVGISPLIVHSWSKKAIRLIEDVQQKKAKQPRQAKDPEEEFRSCLYLDDKGRYCFPARAFKRAMISATTSIEDKRFPKTKIRQAIFVEGDLLPLTVTNEPTMRCDPVRLPGGGTDLRYRPQFDDWAVNLTITFNETVVSAEQVVNLLNLAGFAVGVGDWRPERDGNSGRFTVRRSDT